MNNYPIYTLPEYIINDRLNMIHPLPKQLFARGAFPYDAHLIFITIIGSRNHTPYGADVCKKLISGLKGYPIVIISGLAVGIDTIVHETALECGIPVIAFPGSGLAEKTLYPRSNVHLVEKILKSGGCVVSELDHTVSGNSWTFPARNRLMAGIAQATLIIEGSHKSGSRITARLATEYDRDVFAVPGPIFTESSEAPNELIKMGATPITCADDILEGLGFSITAQPPLDLFSQCTDNEYKILKKLINPKSRGELIRDLGISTAQANVIITQMEIKGLIAESGGLLRRS
jgi:DNA processing protein